jgi:GTP-binding protein
MISADKIRNLAIIAHIDHGKTTLIDSIFRTARLFRENQHMEERVMDSNELERERGITIRAKQCSVEWGDHLINIVDTPGHADFSGEVERVLSMVDAALLLVDANEGPMPQTRYVLMRALRLGLKVIVIVNKVDRPQANPAGALDKTFDLFLELGANDEQADFPVLYGSGLSGWFVRDMKKDERRNTMEPLFETIVAEVPAPEVNPGAPFRMQISTLGWSDYVGRIAGGRVLEGSVKKGDSVVQTMARWREAGNRSAGWHIVGASNQKVARLWTTRGLDRVEVEEVGAGDIAWIAGPEEIGIGDTFSSPLIENPALQPLEIEEPTVSMFFLANTGPFSGREGKPISLRELRARLEREVRANVALRVEDIGRPDGLKVCGRGELHLAILIEEMRREGLEFCVSRPEVITRRDAQDRLLEPIERLIVDVPQEYQGAVIEKLSRRKGDLGTMEFPSATTVRMEFEIPTRGLIGYRNDFLTDTRGLGIMASRFMGYGAWRGEIAARNRGSAVSMETGQATGYALESLQQRVALFVEPGDEIYAGQIIGENSRAGELPCNPAKKKAMTNHRSSVKEQTVTLNTSRKMSLDQALEWIAQDELVEATPQSVRVRKAILDADTRRKTEKRRSVESETEALV